MSRKIAGLVLAVALLIPAAGTAAQHQVTTRASLWDAVRHWVISLVGGASGLGVQPDDSSVIDPNQ